MTIEELQTQRLTRVLNQMDGYGEQVVSRNPGANPELARFAFLIGTWRCDARLKREDGSWETLPATWIGRYVLDGYVIMDEFRMTRPTRELIVLGVNIRTYDLTKGAWNLRWLNALDGTWTDLAPAEFGGIRMDGQSISYCFKEPVATHSLTRATYLNISAGHFTWRGERSSDGKLWDEFMVVEAQRSD
jgi:hypothetical protein